MSYGCSNLPFHDLQSLREQKRLEPLPLLEVGFQPEPRGVQGDPLGEAQDGFDVELFRPLVVLVDLGQGHGLVHLGELFLVSVLVDDFLEDKGLDELVFAPFQVRNLPLGGGPLCRDFLVPGFPVIQDDHSEEGHELGSGPQAIEEAQELGLQVTSREIRLAAAGLRRTVVVGIALALALGPGAGEGVATVAAGREAPEREIRIVALLGHDLAVGGEEALAAPEGVFVDQGRPVTGSLDVPGPLDDPADVGPIGEHLAPFLGTQLSAAPAAETPLGELFEDLDLGVEAGGEALEAEPDQRSALGIELQGLAVRQVAQRRPEDPLPAAQGFLHASSGPSSPDLVVELGEGREDALHELASRSLVDRLADGPEGDAEAGQVAADDRMVKGVPGKSIDVGDDEDMDVHTPLVLVAQVRQGRLQLGAVGGLGGLAAFDEDAIDLPAVQLAEGATLVFLDGEREVEGLLFAADAAVDDGSE